MPLKVKLYTGREPIKSCYRCNVRFLAGDEVVDMPGERVGRSKTLVHVLCSPVAGGKKKGSHGRHKG